jgi:hypothetical protein
MARNIFQKIYYNRLGKIYKRFPDTMPENVVHDTLDLVDYFEGVFNNLPFEKRILITYHNHLWEPTLSLASYLGFRKKVGVQNWLDEKDIANILNISGFEVISTQTHLLGLIMTTIARKMNRERSMVDRKYSVSIVVPARNEEGNIPKIVSSIPRFGKWQEIIFVEGGSRDNTWDRIVEITNKKTRPSLKLRRARQKGKGKADAVWLGFEKAKGDILMIYDADRTVDANDLPKFYKVLAADIGEFANGSRLVYPMEQDSMRFLNQLGNKFFGFVFTKILGQNFKDTLCGTKALFRKDYLHMRKHNKRYFMMDPFGDFALIFGAIKNNLKVVEIPVRYKERVYGSTNINRFRHGLMLLKMTIAAFREFRA